MQMHPAAYTRDRVHFSDAASYARRIPPEYAKAGAGSRGSRRPIAMQLEGPHRNSLNQLHRLSSYRA